MALKLMVQIHAYCIGATVLMAVLSPSLTKLKRDEHKKLKLKPFFAALTPNVKELNKEGRVAKSSKHANFQAPLFNLSTFTNRPFVYHPDKQLSRARIF